MATRLRLPKLTRDLVLFLVGLVGLAHETLWVPEPRTILLGVFCVMMGLPAFFNLDERRRPPEDD